MFDKLLVFLSTLPGLPRPRNPKPVTRKRLYATLELVCGVAVVWGVIDEGAVDGVLASWEALVGLAYARLSRKNVTPDAPEVKRSAAWN